MQTDSSKTNIFAMNTLPLAYLGDAVWELFVRNRLLAGGRVFGNNADLLHREGVRYVNAKAQCRAIGEMQKSLTPEERALVMRARNHKTATRAKNADPMEYKWATAFEALLGALHLCGDKERLLQLMELAASIMEGQEK